MLPHLSHTVSISNYDTVRRMNSNIESNIFAVGFNFEQVVKFELHQVLWKVLVANDKVILSEPVAKQLNIKPGDLVHVFSE